MVEYRGGTERRRSINGSVPSIQLIKVYPPLSCWSTDLRLRIWHLKAKHFSRFRFNWKFSTSLHVWSLARLGWFISPVLADLWMEEKENPRNFLSPSLSCFVLAFWGVLLGLLAERSLCRVFIRFYFSLFKEGNREVAIYSVFFLSLGKVHEKRSLRWNRRTAWWM